MWLKSWIRPSGKRFFPWLVAGACLGCWASTCCTTASSTAACWRHHSPPPPPSRRETPLPSGEADATTVTLTEVKRKVAGVRVERARSVALPSEVGVSGRIEATPDRRIDVRPGVAGVVRKVHVALGRR